MEEEQGGLLPEILWRSPVEMVKAEIKFFRGTPNEHNLAKIGALKRPNTEAPFLTLPTYHLRWKSQSNAKGYCPLTLRSKERARILNKLKNTALSCFRKITEASKAEDPLAWYKLEFDRNTELQGSTLSFMRYQMLLTEQELQEIKSLLEITGRINYMNISMNQTGYYPKTISGHPIYIDDPYYNSLLFPENRFDPGCAPLWFILQDLFQFGKAFHYLEFMTEATNIIMGAERYYKNPMMPIIVHLDRLKKAPVHQKKHLAELKKLSPIFRDAPGRGIKNYEDAVYVAAKQLSLLINGGMKGLQPSIFLEGDDADLAVNIHASGKFKLNPGEKFRKQIPKTIKSGGSLFGMFEASAPIMKPVLWYWLGRTLAADHEIRICPECGIIFSRGSGRRGRAPIFCSRRCTNRSTNRLFQRQKNKQRKEKKNQ